MPDARQEQPDPPEDEAGFVRDVAVLLGLSPEEVRRRLRTGQLKVSAEPRGKREWGVFEAHPDLAARCAEILGKGKRRSVCRFPLRWLMPASSSPPSTSGTTTTMKRRLVWTRPAPSLSRRWS